MPPNPPAVQPPQPHAVLPHVFCSVCQCEMAWVVDRERMRISRTKIACMADGCTERAKEYKVPVIPLEPA